MNEKLKNAIQWSFFICILLIFVVGFIIPLFILIFSATPVDKIINWMNYAGIGLSVISLGLALYSSRESSKSQEKLEASLKNLENIQNDLNNSLTEVKLLVNYVKSSQDRIENRLDAIKNIESTKEGLDLTLWKHDATGTGE